MMEMIYIAKDIPLWQVTIWDKKFNNVDKKWQPKTIKYKYLLSDELDSLRVDDGDVRILYTGKDVGFTTEELAGDRLSEGEIISIPWGGIPTVKYHKGKFVTGDNRIATSKDINKLTNKYLYYFMRGNIHEIASYYRGASLKHPCMKDILKMTISYPSVQEQDKICGQFDVLEQIIEVRKQELQLLDDLIKARFVEMFGDPVHSDKYGTRKLSSCVAEKTDMVDGPFGSQVNTKIDYIAKGEIPVIRTVNVKKMSFSPVDLKYMTRKKYETVIRSQVLPGDVILTKVGTIGNVCVFPDTYKEAVLSTTGSCRIRVDNSIVNTEFFAYNLLYLKSKLLEIASAGVQPFLNMNHVKNIDILNVPLGKQTKFADFVHQVDKSKVAVQKALDETQMLFDSLMQKYFG